MLLAPPPTQEKMQLSLCQARALTWRKWGVLPPQTLGNKMLLERALGQTHKKMQLSRCQARAPTRKKGQIPARHTLRNKSSLEQTLGQTLEQAVRQRPQLIRRQRPVRMSLAPPPAQKKKQLSLCQARALMWEQGWVLPPQMLGNKMLLERALGRTHQKMQDCRCQLRAPMLEQTLGLVQEVAQELLLDQGPQPVRHQRLARMSVAPPQTHQTMQFSRCRTRALTRNKG
jgi:hypothetical protein